MKSLFISALILGLCCSAFAAEPAKPLPGDKCPVCGMFVAKYPDFLTRVVFKDGSYAVFDGPKDMFKYLLNLPKYNPAKKPADIESVFVTDYYSLRMIDGRKAFYVAGSNVTGPMGHELIPFEKTEEAAEFMTDHAGKSRLLFDEVTSDLMRTLD
ncbi:MAG: nitrous oxide reductase accessory protein NosL [Syntrophobacter sp.]